MKNAGKTGQVKIVCFDEEEETLEDKIDDMIERKQAIAASIVGAGENWLTELSTDQLKELFALRRDAVGE